MKPPESAPKRTNKSGTVITTIIIIAIALPLYIHWFNSNHYSTTSQNNYISSCVKNGADTNRCACTYNVLSNQFSYQEFKKMNSGTPDTPSEAAAVISAARQCGANI